jgi:hypothetical protein
MAVYQVSKIQIRRGKTYGGTGLPQLASGELAWSIDTAELFIGNGSVAEGAPQVGNTKILTQNDLLSQGNLLNLASYAYRSNTLITGTGANFPTVRTVQVVLDDHVNTDDFGTTRNGINDDTEALQRAIFQLFLNEANPSYGTSISSIKSRVVLNMLPGKYLITSTIYIPSYTTIVGAGADKTIINFTGTGPVFQYINDSSTMDVISPITATLGITQPRNIVIDGVGVNITNNSAIGFKLDATKNCILQNIALYGNWNNVVNVSHSAIQLNAFSDIVTCENNTFKNITINGFTYGVYAKQDIYNNTFDNIIISDSNMGFGLGIAANGGSTGETYGPRQTTISNCKFTNIKKQAIFINRGNANVLSNIKMVNVGNDGGSAPLYPQIYSTYAGNSISQIQSDRYAILSLTTSNYKYIPEVSGHGEYSSGATITAYIGQLSSYQPLLRLPVTTDVYGVAGGSVLFDISYIYNSIGNFTRKGTISITADVDHGAIQLSDDYLFAGTGSSSTQLSLDFKAGFLDELGAVYTGAVGQIASTIVLSYINTLSGDAGTLNFSYKMMC